jgi:hypothetical protein
MTNIFQRVETTNQPVIGMYPMKKCYVSQSFVCIPVIGFMVCKNQKKNKNPCSARDVSFRTWNLGFPVWDGHTKWWCHAPGISG